MAVWWLPGCCSGGSRWEVRASVLPIGDMILGGVEAIVHVDGAGGGKACEGRPAWLAGDAYACSPSFPCRGEIICCKVAVIPASCLLMSAFSASTASLAWIAAWSSLLWSELLSCLITPSRWAILCLVFSRTARCAILSVWVNWHRKMVSEL